MTNRSYRTLGPSTTAPASRRWARPVLVAAISVTSLTGCRSSKVTQGPEAVFRRWNELAATNDPKGRSLTCADPGTADDYESPITAYPTGFPVVRSSGSYVPAMYTNTNPGDVHAVIDFTDPGTSTKGDEDDVFVKLVKERTGWKVCRVQITAAGGFG